MISTATVVSTSAPPTTYKIPVEQRGQPDYPISAWDLIDFGESPARWVKTPKPDDSEKVSFSEAVRLLHLTPELVSTRYAVRPETYEAMVLECPKCQSVGTGKICRACNAARRNVTKQRPWSAAAHYCSNWTEDQVKHMRRIIPHELHLRATQATTALQANAEVSTLLADSQVQAAIAGTWHDEDTGLDIPLRTLINYVPNEGSTRDDCTGTISMVRDTAPTQWTSMAYNRGHHIAAAFKHDLCCAAFHISRPHHLWVLIENVEPFLVGRRRTSPEMLQAGRTAYQDLLNAYARALAANTWPAFDPEAPGSLDAWPQFFLEPWMTQGDGKSDRFFGVSASNALPLAA